MWCYSFGSGRAGLCEQGAVGVLQGLQQLRILAIGDISSVATAVALAKLTGLTWMEAGEVTPAVCPQLTALSKLRRFRVTALHARGADGTQRYDRRSYVDWQSQVRM